MVALGSHAPDECKVCKEYGEELEAKLSKAIAFMEDITEDVPEAVYLMTVMLSVLSNHASGIAMDARLLKLSISLNDHLEAVTEVVKLRRHRQVGG